MKNYLKPPHLNPLKISTSFAFKYLFFNSKIYNWTLI